MNLWIMYHEIHKQKRDGFSVSRISKELGLNRRTVKKYLNMREDEFLDYKSDIERAKLLDPYEDFICQRLQECPVASAAQIHDWLKEYHAEIIHVADKTVFNFVLHIREKYGIPKPFEHREYLAAEERPFGKQAQVDFGEYNMTTEENKRKKVHFFAMSLSRSRYKYSIMSDKPFTTLALIAAFENAIRYFGGLMETVVLDQDKLMLVSENYGDLILTAEFKKYVEFRKFKLHFCRKSDPASKGLIENVVKYIKYNFLRGRKYIDIQTLNGQCIAWLERTANAKVHGTTKKVPAEEWQTEKTYLTPITELYTLPEPEKEYNVRKDNIISYHGNRYQLPLGTFSAPKTLVKVIRNENQIVIKNSNGTEIARYKVSSGKGQLICNSNFKRDYSAKISELIEELAETFSEPTIAKEYFEKVRLSNRRYIRDQLQLIKKLTDQFGMEIMNRTLILCDKQNILKATDMQAYALKIAVNDKNNKLNETKDKIEIHTMNKNSFILAPEKSNVNDYKSIM